jgi:7,8-dihydropterin-6-yl-methyl-4-(beta-D-ribofuranosyl)aminobenzene 5'-phosphate synthase
LLAAGGQVVGEVESRLLLDDMFYLSGEIPRVTTYEDGLPGHLMRASADGEWEPDPWLLDERFIAVHIKGKGIIVFSACSHAGIVNVLSHARDLFDPIPLYGVMGGFHLAGAKMEKIIPETVEDLRQFDLKVIIPGHCTGWRAVHALLDAFGEEVIIPSAVGRLHEFVADVAVPH